MRFIRLQTLSILLMAGLCLFSGLAYAQTATDKSVLENLGKAAQTPYGANPSNPSAVQPGQVVGRFATAAFGFVGTIAFAFLVYGGFLWLTAGGNEDQVERAKKYLRNAVIGIIVIVLAYSASLYIVDLVYRSAQLQSVGP